MAQVRASLAPPQRVPFGETAVQMGFVGDAEIRQALGEQDAARSNGGQPHAIGQLLRASGHLTTEQVTTVLRGMADDRAPLSRDGVHIAVQLRARHNAAGNVIGIAATTEDDGATTTAELAITLSCMERGRVIAVDANLHNPILHKLLGTPSTPGFAEAIEAGHVPPIPLNTRFGSLAVLPAGHGAYQPSTAMMSPAAAHVVDVYRRHFRYQLLNLGDMLRRPEAVVCASRCDGVVVVVRANHANKRELAEIQRKLQGVNVALSGVVIARPPPRRSLWSRFGGMR